MTYEFSQILINNSDVLLVMHFFSAEDAGMYAALALLGRAVFFLTWSIANVMFPKVVEKSQKGEAHLPLLVKAMLNVAVLVLIILSFSSLIPEQIIGLTFGSDYLVIAKYLWLYVLNTGIFALANLIVYYGLSLNKLFPVGLSLLAGLAQVIGIVLFHAELVQVLVVQFVIMTLLLGSLVLSLFSERYSKRFHISPSIK